MKRLWQHWSAISSADRTVTLAVMSLIANLLYAFYHGGLGLVGHSAWLLTNGLYYLLLAVARFIALLYAQRRQNAPGLCAAVGLLLFALSGLLGGLVFHSLRRDVATVYGTIPMITIATVTFTKIAIAGAGAIRQRRRLSAALRTIHTIRYAEIAVSLCTMQRSMLATFGEAGDPAAAILNRCTGIAVCLFIIGLGVYLLYYSRKESSRYGKIPPC